MLPPLQAGGRGNSEAEDSTALYAGELSQSRSGCAPSGAQDARPLYPGPLCGSEVGSKGPEGGIDTMSIPFRQHTDVLSKSPAAPHALSGQDAQKALRGVAFSLGYFSFGQAKEK